MICPSRIKEIAGGSSPLIGEKERLALTALHWHQEHRIAVQAFQETGRNLLLAQEQISDLIAQLEAAQKENGVVRNKYESMSTAYSSVTAELAKAEAALSAANERASREYPDTLPCPVRIEPGLLLGKGLPIAMLFRALSRRADYEAEIYAMTPEQRAEHDQRMREGKKFISECIAPRPAGFTVEGNADAE
ncbi:TPA: hypothetical protein ACHJX8_004289 [Yersinia enterocolitica]